MNTRAIRSQYLLNTIIRLLLIAFSSSQYRKTHCSTKHTKCINFHCMRAPHSRNSICWFKDTSAHAMFRIIKLILDLHPVFNNYRHALSLSRTRFNLVLRNFPHTHTKFNCHILFITTQCCAAQGFVCTSKNYTHTHTFWPELMSILVAFGCGRLSTWECKVFFFQMFTFNI